MNAFFVVFFGEGGDWSQIGPIQNLVETTNFLSII